MVPKVSMIFLKSNPLRCFFGLLTLTSVSAGLVSMISMGSETATDFSTGVLLAFFVFFLFFKPQRPYFALFFVVFF